jgi:hypothetical protein
MMSHNGLIPYQRNVGHPGDYRRVTTPIRQLELLAYQEISHLPVRSLSPAEYRRKNSQNANTSFASQLLSYGIFADCSI